MESWTTFSRRGASAQWGSCARPCTALRTALTAPCRPLLSRASFTSPAIVPASTHLRARGRLNRQTLRAQEHGNDFILDPFLADYVEAKVDSVRVMKGGPSVVYLRLQDEKRHCLSVWIGEAESHALLREMQKEPKGRPLTHDVAKDLLAVLGYRVTKVRINDIVSETYYARIHVAKPGGAPGEEVDVDARPSDAINLAIRFGSPIYVRRSIAALAAPYPGTSSAHSQSESHTEIATSVREVLADFVDPTVMDTLQKELAIHEQRFKDAHQFQKRIARKMTTNGLLRLVVAMESALGDGRYEEAGRLRDEYLAAKAKGKLQQEEESAVADGDGLPSAVAPTSATTTHSDREMA